MKASYLMIGDLVKLMNPKGEWLTNVRINKDLFIPFLRDEENGFVRFEPIPLTAEILEKNGWKGGDQFFTSFIKPYGKLSHCGTYLKYVHELQHALRLCGLNELADNFKL